MSNGVSLNCGTYEDYKLRAYIGYTNSNWETADLPVKIVVEPGEAEITVSYNSITKAYCFRYFPLSLRYF